MAQTITLSENTLLKLLLRRGSNEERKLVKPSKGELIYTVDSRRVFVGDGSTYGGYVVGNKFYGSGTDVINPTIPQNTNLTNGYAYYGDSYFNTVNASYYVLTGTDVTNLSSWQMVGNITTGNNTTTVRNNDGTLSLLPLSAGSFDSRIFTGGLSSNGKYISLGPTIYTNTILPLNGTTLTLSAYGDHYIQISNSVLKFAPDAVVPLELPLYAKFGTAEVNFQQGNDWNNNVGYLYKDTDTIQVRPTLGSSTTYLTQPAVLFGDANTPGQINIGYTSLSSFGLSTFKIDFTTSGASTLTAYTTVSGISSVGALLFNGLVVYNDVGNSNISIIVNTDANNGYLDPISLTAFKNNRTGTYLTTFSFFAPMSAATTSTNSIGTMELTLSASASIGEFRLDYLQVIAVV